MPRPLAIAVFLAIAFTLLGLIDLYLYRRLVHAVTPSRRWRRIGLGTLIGLSALIVVGATVEAVFHARWANAVATGGWMWLGMLGVLPALTVLAEAPRLAVWILGKVKGTPVSPQRRLLLAQTLAGGVATVGAGLGAYGMYRAFAEPELSLLEVKLPGLPKALDGFSIVQVSDIHLGPILQRRFLEEMVRRCNALKPDLVAVTGDLVDGSVSELGHVASALQGLRSREGTFFVTGNHDYYSGDEEWCEALTGLGVTVLRNRRIRIGEGKDSFELAGVDDWQGRPGRRYDLGAALEGWTPDRPTVLLAHRPSGFEEVAGRGIGLQLSGHTHAGQLWPMTLAIPLLWRYPAGHAQLGESHIYVSRGTGFWGPPMRIGSPPEIVQVILKA